MPFGCSYPSFSHFTQLIHVYMADLYLIPACIYALSMGMSASAWLGTTYVDGGYIPRKIADVELNTMPVDLSAGKDKDIEYGRDSYKSTMLKIISSAESELRMTCIIIINTQMVAVALRPWTSHPDDRAEP